MTGTAAACLHTNQSRSYLNHLVHVYAVSAVIPEPHTILTKAVMLVTV